MERPDEPVFFREEQRFRQGWLWALIIAMDLAVCLPLLVPLFELGNYRGTGSGARIPLLAGPAICLAITALFIGLRLVTRVDAGGISVRFLPFHRRPVVFSLVDIREVWLRTYRPIIEYGGWGIKRGPGSLAYSVSGNQGLQLVLHDGRRILIGTQKPLQMISVITAILKTRGSCDGM